MWKLHFWNAENCNPKVQHIFNVSKNIDWPDEIKYFPIYSDRVKSIGRSVLTFGLILPEFHPHLFQRIVNVSKTMNNGGWTDGPSFNLWFFENKISILILKVS